MTAKIDIRDVNGNPLTNIDFGTITPNSTSNSFIFRVYNNYDQETNITPAYNVKVELTLYEKSKIKRVFKKPLESDILANGNLEIDCTISSKLNGGYPNIDWTPLQMIDNTSSFSGNEFDIIYPDAPNNFNEYKIRLNNIVSENYYTEGNYKIFIRVTWSDNENGNN